MEEYDDNDDEVCVEDVSNDEDDDDGDDDTHKNETKEPVISEDYGRGMRIRKQPESYKPSMSGQSYKAGVNKLCYRGTRYSLSEITQGDGEIPYKMGILNVNCEAPVTEPGRLDKQQQFGRENAGGYLSIAIQLKKGNGIIW